MARGLLVRSFVVTGFVAAAIVVVAPVGSAQLTMPLGFVDQAVANVSAPTGLAFTPDGRVLVLNKGGRVYVIKNDLLQPIPALDLTTKVCDDNERGLVGVAVDPAFASNHFIYLFYTFKKFSTCLSKAPNVPVNRVSRFVLPDTNVISPSSETVLIDNIQNYGGYHLAGDLAFGKDGYLYVTSGDGGCDYARNHLCQDANQAARDRNVLLGKVLRITRDGGIPAGNPFTGALTARCNTSGSTTSGTTCREIFATGLRNPFRFAFDPNASGTTTTFNINDVGGSYWEEVDQGQAGADYGWNVREGHCTHSYTNCGAPPAGMSNPLFDYPHTSGCTSITGGAFVPTNAGWPASFRGAYLFGDFVCGTIFRLDRPGSGYTMTPFVSGLGTSSVVHMAFGPSPQGTALYYTTFASTPSVRRIVFASNGVPVAQMTASPKVGQAPLTTTFDGSGSHDPEEDPLTFVWDFADGATATTTSPTTSHTYTTNGTFTASLRVRDPGGKTSPAVTQTILVGDTPPQPTITSPPQGSLFKVGQTITLSGSATDAEEGTLPASRLSWTVIRHHATHFHPYFGPATGNNLTITGPSPEESSATTNSYLEIFLTATDSHGVSTTVSRNMHPRIVQLSFHTSPSSLQLTVNGLTSVAPFHVSSWAGWGVVVKAAAVQGAHVFRSWSDKGARKHTITTPDADLVHYTAFYT